MKHVADVMSTEMACCHMNDSMNRAAQLMWEHDCGCVPIVDDERRVIGIITDRDICMATYTQGKPLAELPVSIACARELQTCKASDSLAHAEELMTKSQVRRLPVVDNQGVLVGLVSLSDLAHHAKSTGVSDKLAQRTISALLEAVSRRRRSADAERRAGDRSANTQATL